MSARRGSPNVYPGASRSVRSFRRNTQHRASFTVWVLVAWSSLSVSGARAPHHRRVGARRATFGGSTCSRRASSSERLKPNVDFRWSSGCARCAERRTSTDPGAFFAPFSFNRLRPDLHQSSSLPIYFTSCRVPCRLMYSDAAFFSHVVCVCVWQPASADR